MQGGLAGSWAPLGLLLACLHLPGMEAVWTLGKERTGGLGGTGVERRDKGRRGYSGVPEGGEGWPRGSERM